MMMQDKPSVQACVRVGATTQYVPQLPRQVWFDVWIPVPHVLLHDPHAPQLDG